MNDLTRVRFVADTNVSGLIVARRPKTRQIYVIVEGDGATLDNWYSEESWDSEDA